MVNIKLLKQGGFLNRLFKISRPKAATLSSLRSPSAKNNGLIAKYKKTLLLK
jgi:hypothetical protein